jgi:hypothetical protein
MHLRKEKKNMDFKMYNIPTLHSHTHCQVAPADTQTKTWQRVCLSNRTTKTNEKQMNEKKHRSAALNQIACFLCTKNQL